MKSSCWTVRATSGSLSVAVLLAMSLSTTGCRRDTEAEPLFETVSPTTAVPSEPEVSVGAIDEDELAARIAEHRGRVILIDYWATWCHGCVEGFPHTVDLHKQHADAGLTVMSVSFDEPETDRDAVLGFLRKKEATFENFISAYGLTEKSWEAFDITDGALPHLKLYDRSGHLHATFGGNDDPESIDRAIKELLGTR